MPSSNRRLVDIGKLVSSFGKILGQRWSTPELASQCNELRHHSRSASLESCPQVVENCFPGLLIQSKVAVPRKAGYPGLDLTNDLLACATKQRKKPLIESKLPPLISDEIQHETSGFACIQAKSASQLL